MLDSKRPPSCPRCSYNLSGSTSPICPECGCDIPEELYRLGGSKQARWIVGAFAIATMLWGLLAILRAAIGFTMLYAAPGIDPVSTVMSLASACALAVSIKRRSSIRGLSKGRYDALGVAAAILVSLAMLAWSWWL